MVDFNTCMTPSDLSYFSLFPPEGLLDLGNKLQKN